MACTAQASTVPSNPLYFAIPVTVAASSTLIFPTSSFAVAYLYDHLDVGPWDLIVRGCHYAILFLIGYVLTCGARGCSTADSSAAQGWVGDPFFGKVLCAKLNEPISSARFTCAARSVPSPGSSSARSAQTRSSSAPPSEKVRTGSLGRCCRFWARALAVVWPSKRGGVSKRAARDYFRK
ncbi:hypothetical protein HPB48_009709 [Haemaphysalis longicornis]|uniref:Uncharacterized protein n=1 Tax=Haemaphysalis longicornis TaxID=44386 RepID=A0A9J6G163_HAELO|nr:hypothetical protein HPB48_009709 [Haemaphysalis longicornis]